MHPIDDIGEIIYRALIVTGFNYTQCRKISDTFSWSDGKLVSGIATHPETGKGVIWGYTDGTPMPYPVSPHKIVRVIFIDYVTEQVSDITSSMDLIATKYPGTLIILHD